MDVPQNIFQQVAICPIQRIPYLNVISASLSWLSQIRGEDLPAISTNFQSLNRYSSSSLRRLIRHRELFLNPVFGVFPGTYFFYAFQIYKLFKPFYGRILMNIYLL